MQHLSQQPIAQNPPNSDSIIPISKCHDLCGETDGVIEPFLWVAPPKDACSDRQ
jgi:hypothetical protein